MTARRIVYGAWRSLPRRTLGPAARTPCTLCGALLQTNSFGTSAAVDAARTPPKSDAFRSDDAGTDKPHPYPSSEDAVDSRLFGDTDHKALIDEILRVDHAGEYGLSVPASSLRKASLLGGVRAASTAADVPNEFVCSNAPHRVHGVRAAGPNVRRGSDLQAP